MPKPILLNTLGRLSVEREGRRLAGAAAQPRRLALLALLAEAGDKGVQRDRILALLWPDADEDRGRKVLYQAVYALRQEFGDDEAVEGSRDLHLNPEIVETDIGRFRAAVARGDLAAAVDAYQGPFLDGFLLANAPEFERWSEEVRSALAREYAVILERLARTSTERGDAVAATGWWRKLAAADPLNARATVGLMEALVAAGDRTGALQHARVYELLLQQELELPPDREVVALAARIRGETTVGATAPWAPVTQPTTVAPAAISTTSVASVTPKEPAPPVTAAVADTDVAPVMEAVTAAPAALIAEAAFADRAPPPRKPLLRAVAEVAIIVASIGALMMFVRSATPEPTLPTASGTPRRVTTEAGLEVDPALSPDGRFVAYAAGPQNAMQLYVRLLDPSARPVAVAAAVPTPHRRPRWSPDGTQLVFQSAVGIHVVPAFGGPATLLATAPGEFAPRTATWSPNGEQVAYFAWDTVVVRTLASGSEVRLGNVLEGHTLAWSPDGRWIAAVSGNPAFLYGDRLGTGGTGIGNIASSHVVLLPSTGGTAVRVTSVEGINTAPEWLDARTLLLVSQRGAARDVVALTIGEDGRPIRPPTPLTSGLQVHGIAAGRGTPMLVYSVLTRTANLWSVALPRLGGPPASLADARAMTSGTEAVESMDISPDGRMIAFDSDRAGTQDIYVMPIDGGDPQPIVGDPKDAFRADWSPDGRELAYYAFVAGVRHLFTVSSRGGTPVRVLPQDVGEAHSPDWSPDGRRIVFHRNLVSGAQLLVVERTADGGWSPPRRIGDATCGQGRWSPDGKKILCTASGDLLILDADGSRARILISSASAPDGAAPAYARWSPDGREVLYKAYAKNGQVPSLWAAPVSGGLPRLLLRFDDRVRTSPRAEFATDGRRLYFTLEQAESDIWMMPLSR